MNRRESRPISLYIHVPFCRARCLYCSFPTRPAGPSTQTQYIEELSREILSWFDVNKDFNVETVYVGGGTPSTLSPGDIENLLGTIRAVAPNASEITFEANPHIDDIGKIPTLIENGVNRLSVGVQSFDDTELGIAGRLHSSDDARNFIQACRDIGLENLSIDLIHGLPGQTVESFGRSVEEALARQPEHISLYGLSIDPDSRIGRLTSKQFSDLEIPDSDTQADMYDLARHVFSENGYNQYEISNFAKPGRECRHNIVYWSGDEYVGFGPGATSYVNGTRYRRIADVDKYFAAQFEKKNTIEFLETLSTTRAAAEALVMGLRMADGIDYKRIETRFGVKLTELIGEAIERYRSNGLLEVNDGNMRLNDSAYFISNSIFRDFIL